MTFPDPAKHEYPEWVLIEDYFYYARDVVSFGDELTLEQLNEINKKSAAAMGIKPSNQALDPIARRICTPIEFSRRLQP